MNTHRAHQNEDLRGGSSAQDGTCQERRSAFANDALTSELKHPSACKAEPPEHEPISSAPDDAEPLTDELLDELLNSSNLKDFTDKHCAQLPSLSELLQELLAKHHLVRAEVVRAAGINDTFGYQIFTGQRKASRNKVLQIVFAMGLDLREANHVLQAAGANELHCKNRRDAIIIFCLAHGYSLQATDEELYRFDEETIC